MFDCFFGSTFKVVGGSKTIPENTIRVFISNRSGLSDMPDELWFDKAIARRVDPYLMEKPIPIKYPDSLPKLVHNYKFDPSSIGVTINNQSSINYSNYLRTMDSIKANIGKTFDFEEGLINLNMTVEQFMKYSKFSIKDMEKSSPTGTIEVINEYILMFQSEFSCTQFRIERLIDFELETKLLTSNKTKLLDNNETELLDSNETKLLVDNEIELLDSNEAKLLDSNETIKPESQDKTLIPVKRKRGRPRKVKE